jgi:uncharacterized protein (TIGR04255 family)
MSQKPQGRARFRNAADDRIVQLQNGKLMYHWLGSSGIEYPRYEKIRSEMTDIYDVFSRFVRECHLREVHLNQWEVSYSNALPRGTVWNEPGDWEKVFNSRAMMPASVAGSKLEQFFGNWAYEIPLNRGRLHVQLHSGKDRPGGTDVLVLQLIARGPIADGADGAAQTLEGLAVGHEMIVNGFRDLTSKAAREIWKEVT